jgi:hypothetical protein
MNQWPEWITGSVSGLILMSLVMEAARQLRMTRLSFALLWGTVFTHNRDRAVLIGSLMQLFVSLGSGLLYGMIFGVYGASWWLGGMLGALQAGALLSLLMPIAPLLHPHMARLGAAPNVVRQLEPPGFMGQHYGPWTALPIVLSHILFGLALGIAFASP